MSKSSQLFSPELQKTLSNLKFIGKIRVDEVVDVGSMKILPVCIPTSIYRTAVTRGKESRKTTYGFLQDVIHDAFQILRQTQQSDVVETLLQSIEQATSGIDNLRVTYSSDKKFVADLETLSDMIRINLQQLESERAKNEVRRSEFIA